jgi:hypothetical protein
MLGGTRNAEVELARVGVKLYWTTYATVMRFDGASRWIARSLAIYNSPAAPNCSRIETHPHGAFTFMWKALGERAPLPSKTTAPGREARLAILHALIEDLDERELVDHDCVDAAAAALVAALHAIGLTRSYGQPNAGGLIWMPALAS